MKEILLTEKEMVLWYSLCYYISMARVSFLIKLKKNRLWHRCFPVNFVKFLRTSFLQNTSGQLLF